MKNNVDYSCYDSSIDAKYDFASNRSNRNMSYGYDDNNDNAKRSLKSVFFNLFKRDKNKKSKCTYRSYAVNEREEYADRNEHGSKKHFREVSESINDAYFSRQGFGYFCGEVLLLAGIVGFGTKSWLWFCGLFFGLTIISRVPVLGHLVCILLALGYGYFAGLSAWGLFDSIDAGYAVGAIVTIALSMVNLSGRKA